MPGSFICPYMCRIDASVFLYRAHVFWHVPNMRKKLALSSPRKNAPAAITFMTQADGAISAAIHVSDRAKRLRLSYNDAEGFQLTVPRGISPSVLDAAMPRFVLWVEKILAKRKSLPPPVIFPSFVPIPLLNCEFTTTKSADLDCGKSRASGYSRMVIDGAKRILVNMEGDNLAFYGDVDNMELAGETLRLFLRGLAERLLPERLARLAASVNAGPIKTIVRDQRSRWGSCSKRKNAAKEPTISLNWRSILLPVHLFQHLCWHELAHIKEMNHSPAFYAELARYSPQYRQYEKALDEAWRDLPRWALHQ